MRAAQNSGTTTAAYDTLEMAPAACTFNPEELEKALNGGPVSRNQRSLRLNALTSQQSEKTKMKTSHASATSRNYHVQQSTIFLQKNFYNSIEGSSTFRSEN